jgi:hypothetical protein
MKDRKTLLILLALVLAVRLAYFGLFRDRLFSGPSTQFEQAFAAISLLEGYGVSIPAVQPPVVSASDRDRFIDPADYEGPEAARLPYIKEVPGYAFLLAGLWKLTGTRLWLWAQLLQILLELVAAWGLWRLTARFFGRRAAVAAVLVFAFLFHEARASVIPYKDIVLLYVMLAAAFLAARVFEGGRDGRRPWLPFALLSAATGLGYYFMPNILLYPFFATAALLVLGRIKLRTAVVFVLLAATIVGAAVYPYQAYVRTHRREAGVTPPLFWYRFWLGNQVRAFYSTEEERFQDHLRDRIAATGKSLEEICREEFLASVKAAPLAYAARTARKLLFGTVLVYGNGGDAAYSTSWSKFKADHPEAGFKAYARNRPGRILGMILGTLSASLLFPLASAAVIILGRRKKLAAALFFLHIPLYYILLHMFFHYEARYLLGTLPGYLPLVGFLLAAVTERCQKRAFS